MHENARTGPLQQADELSFLQERFLMLAYDEYGQDRSDLPPEARHHV